MAEVISPEKLAASVNAILEEYRGVVQETLESAVDTTAKELVAELKATSPKDTGAYAASWKQNKTPWKKGAGYGRVAYNEKHYRLTHLLEYGHALKRGGRTIGSVPAQPKIAEAEQHAIANYEKRLKEGLT